MNKFNIKRAPFVRDYLEAVIIGKVNGVDITPVWKKNMSYKLVGIL